MKRREIYIWDFWEWKTLLKVFFFLLFLFFVLVVFEKSPDYIRNHRATQLISTINGRIKSVYPFQSTWQGLTGNSTITEYYKVNYSYIVNGKSYDCIDKIPNSIEDKEFIVKIMNGRQTNISVRYDPLSPNESQIVIER